MHKINLYQLSRDFASRATFHIPKWIISFSIRPPVLVSWWISPHEKVPLTIPRAGMLYLPKALLLCASSPEVFRVSVLVCVCVGILFSLLLWLPNWHEWFWVGITLCPGDAVGNHGADDTADVGCSVKGSWQGWEWNKWAFENITEFVSVSHNAHLQCHNWSGRRWVIPHRFHPNLWPNKFSGQL